MQSVSIHSHKTSETRDRLRTRLNQRKEKFNGAVTRNTATSKIINSTSPYPNANVKSNASPKSFPPLSKIFPSVANTSKKDDKLTEPVAIPPQPETVAKTANAFMEIQPAESPKVSVPKSLANTKAATADLQRSLSSISTCSLNSLMKGTLLGNNSDSRDIDDLLNYILGNKNVDKIALAQKKAAKKTRQRMKKVCFKIS